MYFPLTVGCDMKKEINMVKKNYNDIVINKQETVYDPDMFREFRISAGATMLFDTSYPGLYYKFQAFNRPRISEQKKGCFIYLQLVLLSQPNMQSSSDKSRRN